MHSINNKPWKSKQHKIHHDITSQSTKRSKCNYALPKIFSTFTKTSNGFTFQYMYKILWLCICHTTDVTHFSRNTSWQLSLYNAEQLHGILYFALNLLQKHLSSISQFFRHLYYSYKLIRNVPYPLWLKPFKFVMYYGHKAAGISSESLHFTCHSAYSSATDPPLEIS